MCKSVVKFSKRVSYLSGPFFTAEVQSSCITCSFSSCFQIAIQITYIPSILLKIKELIILYKLLVMINNLYEIYLTCYKRHSFTIFYLT